MKRGRWIDPWAFDWACDIDAEDAAVGAVLAGPRDVARKLVRGAMPREFYDVTNRWMWKQLWIAGRLIDTTIGLKRWLREVTPGLRRFAMVDPVERFGRWLNAGFWWHGWWYLSRVRSAATLRSRTLAAGAAYSRAIVEMRGWK